LFQPIHQKYGLKFLNYLTQIPDCIMHMEFDGSKRYICIIGGTFDSMHQGHQDYIKLAFNFSQKVYLLLSINKYIQKFKMYKVKPYYIRFINVKKYIEKIGYKHNYKIFPLHSESYLFKFCLKHSEISLAIVTPEYYPLFMKINELREKNGISNFLILIKPRTRTLEGFDLSSSWLNGYRNTRQQNKIKFSFGFVSLLMYYIKYKTSQIQWNHIPLLKIFTHKS